MNDIIDVEFKEITDYEEKTVEELTEQANFYYNQTEFLGRLSFEAAARAGKCLNVIKEKLEHGKWDSWQKENLKFSPRKANYMMKLAKTLEDENGIFFKSANVANFEISRVYALLGAPEEVQKEMLEDDKNSEISVKEYKEKIKELTAKLEEEKNKAVIEKSSAELDEANRKIEELTLQIETLSSGRSSESFEEEILKLKKQIETEISKSKKAQDELSKAKEKENAKLEKAKKAAEKEKEEAIKEAVKDANIKNEKERIEIETELNKSKEIISRLEKSLANNSNSDVAEFKVKADVLQQNFNSCLASIVKISGYDDEQAVKLKAALKNVLEILLRQVS